MQKTFRNYRAERNLELREQAYEAFINFMDSIYYEGYAQQLAKDNPQEFTNQVNEYYENHFSNAR